MEELVIKTKNILIRDGEILSRIKSNKIEFLHFYAHKENNGALSIIATIPHKTEMTVSSSYHQVTICENHALVQNPKYFNPYIGKSIQCYTERLFPEEGEIFRMQPDGFRIETTSVKERGTDIKNAPYFSKGGEFIIPQYYLNRLLNHKFVRMKVSFNRTAKVILDKKFLFAFLIKATQIDIGRRKNLYGFRKFSNGLRTKKLGFLIDLLTDNNKKLKDFNYVTTIPYDLCPYGLIVFEERK